MNIYRHNQPFELERGGVSARTDDRIQHLRETECSPRQCHLGLPRPDRRFGRGLMVAAHGRSGQIPRPRRAFHHLRQHTRLALRHDRAAARQSGDRTPLLQRFPRTDDPRHGTGAPAAGRHSWASTASTRLVGSSVGGFQAVEWAVQEPERIGKLVLIATAAKASPWSIAIDETQRMAIEADSTFGEPYATAGMKGLAAARAIGLLSYRGPEGYDLSQQDENDDFSSHRACTYQQYQGEKLCRRYNAYSYYKILNAFDTHDVGYQRGRRGSGAATNHGRMSGRRHFDRPHLHRARNAGAAPDAAAQHLPPDRLPLRTRRVSGRARTTEPNPQPFHPSNS